MTNPPASSSSSGADRSRVLVLVGVVVAVVVAAALVAVFLLGGDDDGADTVTDRPPSTEIDPDVDPGPDDPADDPADDPRLPPALQGVVRPVEIEGDALPSFSDEGADPAVGVRPPTLIAEDAAGSVYTISADIDGPVMLVFLAHWCPACNEEVPHLVELAADGRLPEDLAVYGVLTAAAPDRPNFPPADWIESFGWPFPAVADGVDFDREVWQASDAFGLTGYPYVVIWDDGAVVDRWTGGLGTNQLAARIDAAVG